MQIHQEKSGERYDAGIYSDYSDGFTWFEENLKNKNSHSDLAKIVEKSSTSTYVKTPKGTKVSAIIYDDMTAAEKKKKMICTHRCIQQLNEYIQQQRNLTVIHMHGIHRNIVLINIG